MKIKIVNRSGTPARSDVVRAGMDPAGQPEQPIVEAVERRSCRPASMFSYLKGTRPKIRPQRVGHQAWDRH